MPKTAAARLTVTMRLIGELKPYERNPRINEEAVANVARSIERFGFRQPIVVDEEDVIIVGHTRLKAAEQLGLEKVPVHVAKGLTPEEARAYRLADNRTAELAAWDFDLLPMELLDLQKDGVDLAGLGWEDHELARLLPLGELPPSSEGREFGEEAGDKVEMTECPECGHKFPK